MTKIFSIVETKIPDTKDSTIPTTAPPPKKRRKFFCSLL